MPLMQTDGAGHGDNDKRSQQDIKSRQFMEYNDAKKKGKYDINGSKQCDQANGCQL